MHTAVQFISYGALQVYILDILDHFPIHGLLGVCQGTKDHDIYRISLNIIFIKVLVVASHQGMGLEMISLVIPKN